MAIIYFLAFAIGLIIVIMSVKNIKDPNVHPRLKDWAFLLPSLAVMMLGLVLFLKEMNWNFW